MINHSVFPPRKQHHFFPHCQGLYGIGKKAFTEESVMAASDRLTTGYADEQLCHCGHANGTLQSSVFSSENTRAY